MGTAVGDTGASDGLQVSFAGGKACSILVRIARSAAAAAAPRRAGVRGAMGEGPRGVMPLAFSLGP
jgi:hypothetical protein